MTTGPDISLFSCLFSTEGNNGLMALYGPFIVPGRPGGHLHSALAPGGCVLTLQTPPFPAVLGKLGRVVASLGAQSPYLVTGDQGIVTVPLPRAEYRSEQCVLGE